MDIIFGFNFTTCAETIMKSFLKAIFYNTFSLQFKEIESPSSLYRINRIFIVLIHSGMIVTKSI